jgi:hypothetical protein
MKTKEFDCVRMKREGAKYVQEKLKGMTPEEQAAYWRERTEEMLAWQEKRQRFADEA